MHTVSAIVLPAQQGWNRPSRCLQCTDRWTTDGHMLMPLSSKRYIKCNYCMISLFADQGQAVGQGHPHLVALAAAVVVGQAAHGLAAPAVRAPLLPVATPVERETIVAEMGKL